MTGTSADHASKASTANPQRARPKKRADSSDKLDPAFKRRNRFVYASRAAPHEEGGSEEKDHENVVATTLQTRALIAFANWRAFCGDNGPSRSVVREP